MCMKERARVKVSKNERKQVRGKEREQEREPRSGPEQPQS